MDVEIPSEDIVTAYELAELVGVHNRQISEYASRGIIQKIAPGKFDRRAAVLGLCKYWRDGASRWGAGGGAPDRPDVSLERALLFREQRGGQAMKNMVLRGELIPLEAVESVVGAKVDAVRAKVLAMPTKAAPTVAGKTSLPEIRAILTELATEACSELSSDADLMAELVHRSRARLDLLQAGQESLVQDEAAPEPDGEPVGGRAQNPKPRGQRGTGKVEHSAG